MKLKALKIEDLKNQYNWFCRNIHEIKELSLGKTRVMGWNGRLVPRDLVPEVSSLELQFH